MRLFVSVLLLSFGLVGTAIACPQPQQAVQSFSYTGDFLWQPRTHNVTAGGDVNLERCRLAPTTMRGFVIAQPDFSFQLNGMSGYDLAIDVSEANCDTVLLVRDARGNWIFDDDSGSGLNAYIRLSRPGNGRVDVWVGTYDRSLCDARLRVETWR